MSRVSVQVKVYQYVWVDVENENDKEAIEDEALNMALENPFDFEAEEVNN